MEFARNNCSLSSDQKHQLVFSVSGNQTPGILFNDRILYQLSKLESIKYLKVLR